MVWPPETEGLSSRAIASPVRKLQDRYRTKTDPCDPGGEQKFVLDPPH